MIGKDHVSLTWAWSWKGHPPRSDSADGERGEKLWCCRCLVMKSCRAAARRSSRPLVLQTKTDAAGRKADKALNVDPKDRLRVDKEESVDVIAWARRACRMSLMLGWLRDRPMLSTCEPVLANETRSRNEDSAALDPDASAFSAYRLVQHPWIGTMIRVEEVAASLWGGVGPARSCRPWWGVLPADDQGFARRELGGTRRKELDEGASDPSPTAGGIGL